MAAANCCALSAVAVAAASPAARSNSSALAAPASKSLQSALLGSKLEASFAGVVSPCSRRAFFMGTQASTAAAFAGKTLHDFEVENIKGEKVSLADYKGKVALIVNVASQCGLTDSNYKGLQAIYDKYKDQGFVVLAFPSNQFGAQEPGSNTQIENFACSRYKATFPMFSKVDVNGPNTTPVYQFLKSQKGGGLLGDDIKWNFGKFLVDKEGKVVQRYAPTTGPEGIEADIKKLL